MPFDVRCPHCGAELKADLELVGRQVACKRCGEVIVVTGEAEAPGEESAPSERQKRGLGCGVVALCVLLAAFAVFPMVYKKIKERREV